MNRDMLQFITANGVGEATTKRAIAFLKDNGISWEDLVNDRRELLRLGIKGQIIENVFAAKKTAEVINDKLEKIGAIAITESEERYPQYLKKMLGSKCPPVLFVLGQAELLNSVSVGFCGSRKASAKGINIAGDCARQLAEKNIVVVSGYAAGVDMAAHKAALEHGGKTVFVLAEGILRCIEKNEIKALLNESNHVFVSQFMPNTTWNAGNAMRRNGTIIGLSKAMILVESGKKGGTFAAGEESLRVGCPLFVIDFAQPEVSAEANPYFIKKGGMPIRGKNGIPNLSRVFVAVGSDARSKTYNRKTDDCIQLKMNI